MPKEYCKDEQQVNTLKRVGKAWDRTGTKSCLITAWKTSIGYCACCSSLLDAVAFLTVSSVCVAPAALPVVEVRLVSKFRECVSLRL